jgi:hypothetical protein
MPLKAMPLMQEFSRDGFAKTKMVLFTEFLHAPHGLLSGGTGIFIKGKCLERRIDQLIDRIDQTGFNGLLDGPFLVWSEDYSHRRYSSKPIVAPFVRYINP